MLVQNMPSLAVAMVVAREKNIEKKSIFFKFHETSKYHIFRKSIFSSYLKMFIDFLRALLTFLRAETWTKKFATIISYYVLKFRTIKNFNLSKNSRSLESLDANLRCFLEVIFFLSINYFSLDLPLF